MRYRTRPEKILKVGPVRVTDRPSGHALPDCPTVREHVRLGRLLVVAPEPAPEPKSDPKPRRRADKESN